MLGIIGAMTEEVLHLKEAMEDVEIRTIATMDFYQGRLKGLDVVVVRSGIGKVNAAICTQILIDQYNVRRIINTGIAGSLTSVISYYPGMLCSMPWTQLDLVIRLVRSRRWRNPCSKATAT